MMTATTKTLVAMLGLMIWSMSSSTAQAAVTDTIDFGNGATQAASEAAHNLQLDGWSGGGISADDRWANTGSLYWLMAADSGGGGSYGLTINTKNNRTAVAGGWGNWVLEYQHSAKNNLFNNGDSTVTTVSSGAGDPPLFVPDPNGNTMTAAMDLPFDTAGIGVRYRSFGLIFAFDASLARTAAATHSDVVDFGNGVFQSASQTAHSVVETSTTAGADDQNVAGNVVFTLATPGSGTQTIDVHVRNADTEAGFGAANFEFRAAGSADPFVTFGAPDAVDSLAKIASYNFTAPGAATEFRYQRSSGTHLLFGAGIQTVVPEPASLALLALGGLMMLSRRRKSLRA